MAWESPTRRRQWAWRPRACPAVVRGGQILGDLPAWRAGPAGRPLRRLAPRPGPASAAASVRRHHQHYRRFRIQHARAPEPGHRRQRSRRRQFGADSSAFKPLLRLGCGGVRDLCRRAARAGQGFQRLQRARAARNGVLVRYALPLAARIAFGAGARQPGVWLDRVQARQARDASAVQQVLPAQEDSPQQVATRGGHDDIGGRAAGVQDLLGDRLVAFHAVGVRPTRTASGPGCPRRR
ncbi:hypothetical protein G6F57_018453 [Rhizopus arrhizus]|nr:hypothetical protein G6F57_018453 [Rhizopus arrhizus]